MQCSSRVSSCISSYLMRGMPIKSIIPPSLCFAERAVKMTDSELVDECPFLCMNAVMACGAGSSSATALLSSDGNKTKARVNLSGATAAVVLRKKSIMFHCFGNNSSEVQQFEMDLRSGDILALLSNVSDLSTSTQSVERTLENVNLKKLEDLAEELLVQLGETANPCLSSVARVGCVPRVCAQAPHSNYELRMMMSEDESSAAAESQQQLMSENGSCESAQNMSESVESNSNTSNDSNNTYYSSNNTSNNSNNNNKSNTSSSGGNGASRMMMSCAR